MSLFFATSQNSYVSESGRFTLYVKADRSCAVEDNSTSARHRMPSLSVATSFVTRTEHGVPYAASQPE